MLQQNGVFEIEFQNADARTLTVTQNTNPAAPPPGFVAVEPVSFIVNLAEGAEGVTLQKVDYILNKNSESPPFQLVTDLPLTPPPQTLSTSARAPSAASVPRPAPSSSTLSSASRNSRPTRTSCSSRSRT